jgi:hypothetical protein
MNNKEHEWNKLKAHMESKGYDKSTIHIAWCAYNIGYICGESDEKGKRFIEQWDLDAGGCE